jgi:hypothetical protein
MNNFTTNPYQNNIRPVVSAVPMINLRLPPGLVDSGIPINLRDAVEQDQILMQNGAIVQSKTSLIYSNDVLFFFVDRRASVIRLNDLRPYNIGKLPVSISGFERLNDTVVDFGNEITIRKDIYKLRSVVLSEVNNDSIENNLVVGSSAVIVTQPSDYSEQRYIYYNPMGVVNSFADPLDATKTVRNDPISLIPFAPQAGWDLHHTFKYMAQTRGIIFMYQLYEDNTKGNINL